MTVDSPGDVAPVPQTPPSPTALATPASPTTMEPPVRSLVDALDWSSTPLGPRDSWPAVVQLMVNTCLDSEFPIQLAFGPELVVIYNDAFVPLLGSEKHPWALGRTVGEIWPENEHLIREVITTGQAWHNADQRVILDRHGYPEEAYLTYSQSVIRDLDGTVVGLFNAVSETSSHMLYERRLRLLRSLGAVSVTADESLESTCTAALEVMASNRISLPFAAMYLRRPDGTPHRVAGYGFDEARADICELVAEEPSNGPVVDALESGTAIAETGVRERFPGLFAVSPLGPLSPDRALALPVLLGGEPRPAGVLVVGLNPYRPLDDVYAQFASMVGRQVGVLLNDAAIYLRERERQRRLAELDRDKTEFFQNVTHELRTPLTTLLAPLNDLLDDRGIALPSAARETLEISRRAGARLRKMIGALLEFSVADSGSLTAQRQTTNLASVTADLVGGFQLAAEQAGLALRTELPDSLPANVDRTMWATIVNNLLGNAVKYTAKGEIVVGLSGDDTEVVLAVADTGMGIPVAQQSRIFDRFHRVDDLDRTSGAGIGLALVADAVAAHQGRVEVSSEPGHGSTFTVRLPRTAEPEASAGDVLTAPYDRYDDELAELIGAEPDTRPEREDAVEASLEARAGSQPGTEGTAEGTAPADRPQLLIVEDEPDLRRYLSRLFKRDGYNVLAMPDAETTLAALEDENEPAEPQLILLDVTLPGKSGLELLVLLRQRPRTARVPVIMLTGRSGSENAVEALLAGADDYVVKPFDSAELLARVQAHRHLQELREVAVDEAETVAGQLRQALASNRTIGTAIGIVIARYGLAPDRAFHTLVRISQQSNRKLRDVAEEIVAAGAIPDGPS
jgi:signal transduction histidine kinase/FixJ family two-component response regulator